MISTLNCIEQFIEGYQQWRAHTDIYICSCSYIFSIYRDNMYIYTNIPQLQANCPLESP